MCKLAFIASISVRGRPSNLEGITNISDAIYISCIESFGCQLMILTPLTPLRIELNLIFYHDPPPTITICTVCEFVTDFPTSMSKFYNPFNMFRDVRQIILL